MSHPISLLDGNRRGARDCDIGHVKDSFGQSALFVALKQGDFKRAGETAVVMADRSHHHALGIED